MIIEFVVRKGFMNLFYLCIAALFVLSDCSSKSIPAIENRNLQTVSSSATPISLVNLCDDLPELKRLPHDARQTVDDPVYNKYAAHKNDAIPCLIDKITDTTPMQDPGLSPAVVNDFCVGDAAVFTLLLLTGEEWRPDSMLSPEYAARWKSEGVFAYYRYVEDPANRKRIQSWWKEWSKTHLDYRTS